MKIRKPIVMVLAVVAFTALGYGLAAWLLDKPAQNATSSNQFEQTVTELSREPAKTDGGYAVGDTLESGAVKANTNAAVFDPAYPELEWDRLIPAGWDPTEAFRELKIDNLSDNDPKAQQALETLRKAWNSAPINPDFTNKKIRIPGFAIPIEEGEKGVDEFLLVPYFGACIHTPPPPANQIIHVKLSEPEPAVGSMQAYWVWGELTASKFSSELGDSAYMLKASGLQPYED